MSYYTLRSNLPISNGDDDLNCVFRFQHVHLEHCSVIADFSPFRANWGQYCQYHYQTQKIGRIPNLIRLLLVLVRKFSLALLGNDDHVRNIYPRFLPGHNICICIIQITNQKSHHISHFVTTITTSMTGMDCDRECQTRQIVAVPHGKTSPCYQG